MIHAARRSLSLVVRAFPMFLLAGLGPLTSLNCDGGAGGSGGGDPCKGGVIVDGVCEGKCDPALCVAGNTCVGNRCVLVCDDHDDCANDGTQNCTAAVEDDTDAAVSVCLPNGKAPGVGVECFAAKKFGEACGTSSCADGTPCGDQPCADGSACGTHACNTTGEGDALAYCSSFDCSADADCPGGFECADVRQPGTVCGNDLIGNHPLCATTASMDCTNEGDLATLGATTQVGGLCLVRKMCVKKAPCSPCETDLDCSFIADAQCVDVGGAKACAKGCADNGDCQLDEQCDGTNHCVPAFGACKGTGGFCEPCQVDADCGEPGSGKACADLSGGMRACFDFNFPDSCNTDADCPESAGGVNGTCLDEGEGVSPSDGVYKRCYLPLGDKTSCW